MLHTLRKRLDRDEGGFTLIELMVVVLIIAILIAIAIPTFLGAQNRSRDRGAQSTLRNSISAAKTIATDNDGLFATSLGPPVVPIAFGDLNTAEPAITHAAAGAKKVVGVVTAADGTSIVLYTQSASDKWFGMKSTSTGTVSFCSGAAAANVNTAAVCTGTSF
jgi:type IV pilus assembly protein PilA